MHQCKLVLHYIDSWFALSGMLSDFIFIFCVFVCHFCLYLDLFQFDFHRNNLDIFLPFLFAIFMFYLFFHLNFFQFASHRNNLLICFIFAPLDMDLVVWKSSVPYHRKTRFWSSVLFVFHTRVLGVCKTLKVDKLVQTSPSK